MAHRDQGLPAAQEAETPFAHHAAYERQNPRDVARAQVTRDFKSSNQASSKSNRQYDPNNAPITASHQHRPQHHSPQYGQHPPQVVSAVAIPSPQAAHSRNVGKVGGVTSSASALTTGLQHPAHTSHGFSNGLGSQQMRAEPPLDYQLLLLSLAEEYLAAAYSLGSMAALSQRATEVQDYHRLIATALGCLEGLLGHYQMSPDREAMVRLRYATILYEETENTMEAEEALSKGVSLCDRHRFFDLKYNMQHLLTRILFGKSPRAAFKFLDGVIQDAEAYQHIAWVYALRFLKVSLHLEISSRQDTLSVLSQIRDIIKVSHEHGDSTVHVIATAMEALTCLRLSSDLDSFEQAQRALAGVRSSQLDPSIGELHQVAVLASIVDLCCHLQHFDPAQALAKMQVMSTTFKSMDESKSWAPDGSFAIPLPNARMPSCYSRGGMVRREEDGSLALILKWMSREDVYNLGYLLSGIALTHRNTTDGHKSEHMFEEGIKRLQQLHAETANPRLPRSIILADSHQTWQELIICHMRLRLAFTLCARTSWSGAQEQSSIVKTSIQSMISSLSPTPQPLRLLSAYLEAIIHHGIGNLDQALTLYQSDLLSIDTFRKTLHPSQMHQDIALLSAIKIILIIHSSSHLRHDELSTLLAFIEPLCIRNPNYQIQSLYYLLRASMSSSSTILKTKESLHLALQRAKQSENKQLMCIVLSLMSWLFFRGNVGEQAAKGASASQTLAHKCMDGLWISVAAGVLGNTLEAAGRMEEAKVAREDGLKTAESLPEALQVVMSGEARSEDASGTAQNSFEVPPTVGAKEMGNEDGATAK